jgi:hypothetical protein
MKMSFHDKEKFPQYNTPKIIEQLSKHGLSVDKPSQLSDAFRLGYLAAKMEKQSEKH